MKWGMERKNIYLYHRKVGMMPGQSDEYSDRQIYQASITSYGGIWRPSFMRLQLT